MTLEELKKYCREGRKASAAVRGRMDAEKLGLKVEIIGDWSAILDALYNHRASEVAHDDKVVQITTWTTWPVVDENKCTTLVFKNHEGNWVLTQAQE